MKRYWTQLFCFPPVTGSNTEKVAILVGKKSIRGPAIGANFELWKKFCKITLKLINPILRSQVAMNSKNPLRTDI